MANPVDELTWLEKQFGDACQQVLVEGDDPLLLDDPSYAYVTRVPQHQLFCVSHRDGKAQGRREHVALCRAGQLLFGLKPSVGADPAALLLSGIAGSHVYRIPAERFLAALSDPEARPRLLRLFDGWIELLIATLPPAPVPTRCHPISAGQTLKLSGAAPLRAREGLVWIGLNGAPDRHGAVVVPERVSGPLKWPITESTWILFEGERAIGASSGDLFGEGKGVEFAEGFYAFVVALLARMRVGLEEQRLERDAVSRSAERRFVGESLAQLAAVGRGERLAPDLGHGDAFEQACRAILRWLEVSPPEIPKLRGPGFSHVQTALSRLTGVRTRKVLFEGAWYTHDSGALLGFLIEEREESGDAGDGENEGRDELHPVALLPSRTGYELYDLRSSARERVTPALAERLHPQGFQFYPPLPDRPIAPLDVLYFSSRRARRDIVFVLAVGMGLGSLATLIPLLTGQVFDHLIPGAERALLLQLTLVLVCVYLGQALFDVARGLALVRAQTRMDATLEAAVWDRLLGLPLPFFRDYSAGELASRAAGIGAIREILAGTTLSALLGGIFSLWNAGLLFVIDSRLALAATLLVGVAAVPAIVATHYGLKRQRAVAEIDGKIEGLLLQLLSGIMKLRVTSAENRAFAVWARLFARRRDADLGAERVNIRIAVFQSAFPIVCSIVLYWMLVGSGNQNLGTGQFLAFSTAFGMFLGAMMHVVHAGLNSLLVIPLYERAKPILTQRSESQGGGQRVDLKGSIEVNHVSFRYDPKGPLILDDVSLQIGADEFVALVGPSGSGKSTLLRLLLGFETPSEGGVFYDGQALSGLDVRVVRKQIGVVMQNSRVMTGDIFTNIVGATGLTPEDAWRAARSAALDKDIEAMPMGMQTVIAQGGGTLSGGQRQRLLIARALAGEPKLLFFDEATSALDNVTQAAVSQSLESLRVTRVVIAHRLSTIRHADKIIVLERGKVVQTGRFDDLIAVEGPFAALAKRQMV